MVTCKSGGLVTVGSSPTILTNFLLDKYLWGVYSVEVLIVFFVILWAVKL